MNFPKASLTFKPDVIYDDGELLCTQLSFPTLLERLTTVPQVEATDNRADALILTWELMTTSLT